VVVSKINFIDKTESSHWNSEGNIIIFLITIHNTLSFWVCWTYFNWVATEEWIKQAQLQLPRQQLLLQFFKALIEQRSNFYWVCLKIGYSWSDHRSSFYKIFYSLSFIPFLMWAYYWRNIKRWKNIYSLDAFLQNLLWDADWKAFVNKWIWIKKERAFAAIWRSDQLHMK